MDLKALRLLVVDDNRHAAEIVKSILASVGAQDIADAATPDRAFKLMKEMPFDVVVVDQNLGQGDDGIQLVRRIRSDPSSPNPYVPILMLTGYTEQRRVKAARDAGVTEFLSKPFTITGLLRRMDALIHAPRPFVRSADYFGPDRRRRADPDYTGPERRNRD
ncbi:response regulator [Phenylobacterium hankyongense]|uniref:Response regulator n=1 Tax=Phenylobacterium hankyongense TaxID=1813876 RepID=A0A328AZ68_9CAUL|nr:response regulator [Phenylobacterium hankyongense]RAK58966.1 response regulator [Phenylobacterium hankyongense]